MKNRTFLLILMILVVFYSCSTAPVVEEEPEPEVVAEVTETEPAPVVEPVEEEPEEVIVNEESGYEVSVEVYEKTLDEIRALIKKLNGIISERDYDKWKLYLSEDYINKYNDKTTLTGITESSKILSDNNIELLNLKDYFEWVVVPSRSRASADDIVFDDDTHLTVYMLIKEKRTILYQLEMIDDNWLISVW